MIDIIDEIKKYKSISIIGNYKNVGKTTTLNFIINKAEDKILGLTSIGIDGEEKDIITNTNKPQIYINKNTIIATAKSYLLQSDITKEILENTDINTPLGKIIIFRALSDGYIKLCGPSINSQVKQIIDKIKKYNIDIVIVDGALSRKTLASPSITDATIFCSGAALSKDINKVVQDTIYEVALLEIEKIKDDKFYEIYKYIKEEKISIINKDYTYKSLNLKTTLNCQDVLLDNIDEDSKYIYINGILTNNILQSITKNIKKYKDIDIIIYDGSKVFVDKDIYDKYRTFDKDIKCIKNINVIGISINPTSPKGYHFESKEFIQKLKQYTDKKVFDVFDEKEVRI